MTIRDRILNHLKQYPEGIDDDNLADALGLKQRQQANSRCRQLEAEGLVRRVKIRGKIRNFLTEAGRAYAPPARPPQLPPGERPWHWEGHVQAAVVTFLQNRGYTIEFAADTASRQPGKDIKAGRDGQALWVTVKGYPTGTTRTRPATQASHWFKQGLFDIVVWRGESQSAALAFALPDFPTYRALAEKASWFQGVSGFSYYWVRADGTVEISSTSGL